MLQRSRPSNVYVRAPTFHVNGRPQQRRQRIVWQAQPGKCCKRHEALVRQIVDAEGSFGMPHAVSEALAGPEGCGCIRAACMQVPHVSGSDKASIAAQEILPASGMHKDFAAAAYTQV